MEQQQQQQQQQLAAHQRTGQYAQHSSTAAVMAINGMLSGFRFTPPMPGRVVDMITPPTPRRFVPGDSTPTAEEQTDRRLHALAVASGVASNTSARLNSKAEHDNL